MQKTAQGDPSFGKYVKRLREVRNLTQEQLAERAELAADTIRRLEHMDFSPSLRTLRKVCGGLGITVSVLFSGFEMLEEDSAYEDLLRLLRGRDHKTLVLVLRLAKELLEHLDESARAR